METLSQITNKNRNCVKITKPRKFHLRTVLINMFSSIFLADTEIGNKILKFVQKFTKTTNIPHIKSNTKKNPPSANKA